MGGGVRNGTEGEGGGEPEGVGGRGETKTVVGWEKDRQQ